MFRDFSYPIIWSGDRLPKLLIHRDDTCPHTIQHVLSLHVFLLTLRYAFSYLSTGSCDSKLQITSRLHLYVVGWDGRVFIAARENRTCDEFHSSNLLVYIFNDSGMTLEHARAVFVLMWVWRQVEYEAINFCGCNAEWETCLSPLNSIVGEVRET